MTEYIIATSMQGRMWFYVRPGKWTMRRAFAMRFLMRRNALQVRDSIDIPAQVWS